MSSTNRRQQLKLKMKLTPILISILISSMLFSQHVCESTQLDWLWKNNRGYRGVGSGLLQQAAQQHASQQHSSDHHYHDMTAASQTLLESQSQNSQSQPSPHHEFSYFDPSASAKQHSFVPTSKVLPVPQIDTAQHGHVLHHASSHQAHQFTDVDQAHDHEQIASHPQGVIEEYNDYDKMPQVLPFLKTFSFSKEIALPSLAQISLLPLKLPVSIFKKTTPKFLKMLNAKLTKGTERPEIIQQLSPPEVHTMPDIEHDHHEAQHLSVHHQQVLPIYKETSDSNPFSQVLTLPQYHIMNMSNGNEQIGLEQQHPRGNPSDQQASYQEYKFNGNLNGRPVGQDQRHIDNQPENSFYDYKQMNANNDESDYHSQHSSPPPSGPSVPMQNWKTTSSIFNRNPWRPIKMLRFEIKDRIYTKQDYQNYNSQPLTTNNQARNHRVVTIPPPPNASWNSSYSIAENDQLLADPAPAPPAQLPAAPETAPEPTEPYPYTEPPYFTRISSKSKKRSKPKGANPSDKLAQASIDMNPDYRSHDALATTLPPYIDSTRSVDEGDSPIGEPSEEQPIARLTDRLKWFLDSVKDKHVNGHIHSHSHKPTRFQNGNHGTASVK